MGHRNAEQKNVHLGIPQSYYGGFATTHLLQAERQLFLDKKAFAKTIIIGESLENNHPRTLIQTEARGVYFYFVLLSTISDINITTEQSERDTSVLFASSIESAKMITKGIFFLTKPYLNSSSQL